MAKESRMSRRRFQEQQANRQKVGRRENLRRSKQTSRSEWLQRMQSVEQKRRVKPQKIATQPEMKRSGATYTLNFWKIFSDRPYVSVAVIVAAAFLIMAKQWWLLLALAILVLIGIYVIGHSHHPNRTLSLEFHLKASRKLSMLQAIQLGCSITTFLATYMKQVVSVDFSSAGSTDALNIVQGVLSTNGGSYGQQGSYILSLLNTLTGGSLWGSYRYATNSSQMMNTAAGRNIVLWVLLLMLAPAMCVLAQFFREPYSRRTQLVTSFIAMLTFIFTPSLMKKWIVEYAVANNLSEAAANNAISVGPMAYIAMVCAIAVFVIAVYREFKHDKFN
ncbi:cytochrome C5 [Lactobacillus corticis]|uniref:Cytochrome C5 n=2 Tax=Lactobacillus corticis TaxID=2201249 RepID=A0A916VHK9_9LACO|nr:cytochrome C5 [Lactobacillus corticis]GFZ26428.1 cytochrome C5 [Lactobacillus corticis]